MSLFKYKDVEVEKFTILYCVLGKSRSGIGVKELVNFNHSLGVTKKGSEERYFLLFKTNLQCLFLAIEYAPIVINQGE